MLAPRAPPLPPRSDLVGRRGVARLRLSIPARFVSVDGHHDCILIDLSATGAQFALAAPRLRGAAGYLMVARLEVFGEVVRVVRGQKGGINGLVFDDPLSHDHVLAVRHHAETFQQREHVALRDQVRRWVTGEA
jgi:PilZ domain